MKSIKEKIKVTYDFTAAWGKYVSDVSPRANKEQSPLPFLLHPSNEGQQVNVSLISNMEIQFHMLFVLNL